MKTWPVDQLLAKGALSVFLCFCALATRAQSGFDAGVRARELLAELKAVPELSPAAAQWLRVRGVVEPGNWWRVWLERRALIEIRARGYCVCVLATPAWPRRRSKGATSNLPLDLREAYLWGERMGITYGDVVDAWEIGNEPDIGFVPENAENYTAYLKAMYLGLKVGAAERRGAGDRRQEAGDSRRNAEGGFQSSTLSHQLTITPAPLVLMAPLALPPGPYFEALVKNQLLSYTDGFNYHYYGYAQDFSGVYRQFERGVQELTADYKNSTVGVQTSESAKSALSFVKKELPVFLTEYGYGTLSGAAAGTVEGRVRQWQWFRDVSAQISRLRIEGPMAFYLPPYLENGTQEFGLFVRPNGGRQRTEDEGRRTVGRGHGADDGGRMAVDGPRIGAHAAASGGRNLAWTAGGLRFVPQDFSVSQAEPWMLRIGAKINGNEASPALAWLLAKDKSQNPSRSWSVNVPAPSRVVVDFVAGSGMLAVKQCQGYFLSDLAGSGFSSGEGELRIYNFGNAIVSGCLDLGQFARASTTNASTISVAPRQMQIVPVKLHLNADDLRPHEWTVSFMSTPAASATSIFVTQLYPDASRMTRRVMTDLSTGEAGSQNEQVIDTREIGREEPPEEKAGRWRVTKGVKIEEQESGWSFAITGFPDEPLRPAVAEFVLPDGFQMPEGSLLELEYRLVTRTSGDCTPMPEPRAPVQIASVGRELLGISWRTENGNLYTVWQTPPAINTWQKYAQAKGSFTMGFYGRANLPWRFSDNRPVALVFMFRPNFLPATFEVRNAVITSYGRP